MNGALLLAVPIALSACVIGCGIAIAIIARRQRPLLLARQQAIAALCAQRGLVSAVAPADFAILGPIDPRWLANSHASPDHMVAVADFTRPGGQHTASSRSSRSRSPA